MEKKTSKNILLAIMGVLILAQLVVGIMNLFEDLISNIISMLPLVFVALYGFWLYKKPHGNMLKYAMLIAAVAYILIAAILIKNGLPIYRQIARLLVAVLLTYVAGRLNRIEQNKYFLAIVLAVQFVCDLIAVSANLSGFSSTFLFTVFYDSITTLTLMIAYFVRYKEHKEAGLIDAPKK